MKITAEALAALLLTSLAGQCIAASAREVLPSDLARTMSTPVTTPPENPKPSDYQLWLMNKPSLIDVGDVVLRSVNANGAGGTQDVKRRLYLLALPFNVPLDQANKTTTLGVQVHPLDSSNVPIYRGSAGDKTKPNVIEIHSVHPSHEYITTLFKKNFVWSSKFTPQFMGASVGEVTVGGDNGKEYSADIPRVVGSLDDEADIANWDYVCVGKAPIIVGMLTNFLLISVSDSVKAIRVKPYFSFKRGILEIKPSKMPGPEFDVNIAEAITPAAYGTLHSPELSSSSAALLASFIEPVSTGPEKSYEIVVKPKK